MASSRNSNPDDETQPGAKVDSELYDEFKAAVAEVYGNVHGNIGPALEDAMERFIAEHGDDATPRNISNLDLYHELEQLRAIIEDTEHAHTNNNQSSAEDTLDQIVTILSNQDKTEYYPSDITRAVNEVGYIDDRTVEKYRTALENQGHLLPHPTKADPKSDESDHYSVYIIDKVKFALICEQNDKITPSRLDTWLGELQNRGILTPDEYRDALPENYREGNDLKLSELSLL